MVKIKAKDKEDSISSSIKYKDTTVLEFIEIIDKVMCALKEEHDVSEEDAINILKEYREQTEEVE